MRFWSAASCQGRKNGHTVFAVRLRRDGDGRGEDGPRSVGVEAHHLICHSKYILCRALLVFSSHLRSLLIYWCPGVQVCPSCVACSRLPVGQFPTCRRAHPHQSCVQWWRRHLHTSGAWQTDSWRSMEYMEKSESFLCVFFVLHQNWDSYYLLIR